jgi:hypothetical protein
VKDPLDADAFDNWDHMAKDEKETPLNSAEKKQFAELEKLVVV